MNIFSDALGRLKHQLRVSKDGEVADLLGMSKSAFAERKRRGSFPEKEVCSLATGRPDLDIDIDYVLTGITREAHARLAANQAAGERESERGGDFRAGWQANDAGMAHIQRALEADRDGFVALAQVWLAMPPEDRDVLINIATVLANKGKNA